MPEQKDLGDSVAIVTGASSGIGAATAESLAAEGASVVLAARRADELEALANSIKSDGGDALAVPTDLTDDGDIEALVEATMDEYGRIDILVNNAGVMLLEPLATADRSNIRQMVEVNLLGLINLTHEALPVMQEQGEGHIVNLSSVSGREEGAMATSTVYTTTKYGVIGFTKALHDEVTNAGIRTTIVEPGYVETELQSHVPHDETRAFLTSGEIPGLSAEDVADNITHAVTRPQHVSVNEVLIQPTQQPDI
nr:SDR family oxidoreductase [Haloferax denitrificans]